MAQTKQRVQKKPSSPKRGAAIKVDKRLLDEVALSEKEYELIVERLGREPNLLELGLFGALWSEHCGYKHSKELLKLLPSQGERVLTKTGAENAGVVDLGDGHRVVMKIESHNHPSAIEPFQGAATGVGGIVRDIFTMGARPIALLNSLRFGLLSESRNRYLFEGVVSGISSYGNCIGVPDVAGDIAFSEAYSANPLVNCMCVGLLEKGDKVISAKASGPGNLLMLVGADTGRDGIHGASGLASRTFEEERELRSAVQVGNPFLEKVLIEACLEVAKTDLIVGLCDLGAAGITSAAIESAARAGTGVEIDISKVPLREEGMDPYEIMLSESQERMLLFVKKGCEEKVQEVFQKWDLHCVAIGQVTRDGMARVMDGKKVIAEVPVAILTDPPRYKISGRKPATLARLQSYNIERVPVPEGSLNPVLLKLLSSPTIASKRMVYQQYDTSVQNNTVIAPGADAAVLRIKGTGKGIALKTDGNGRYCYLDPYAGGALAVAEAARNVACVGATPIAITDGLNFGDPEKPEVAWQMRECTRGMADACKALGIPVVSGNVSLYNETKGVAIYPTPIVGCLGLVEDVRRRCTSAFQEEGDLVFLLGSMDSSLGASQYLETVHKVLAGKPILNLDLERRVTACVAQLVREGTIKSAHDCSDGGLAVALAECCIWGNIGFVGEGHGDRRPDEVFFGESAPRVIVSTSVPKVRDMVATAMQHGVAVHPLGLVAGEWFVFSGRLDLPVQELRDAYEQGLALALKGKS